MRCVGLILALLVRMSAWGQAPNYSSTSIVNASNFTQGAFAPNAVLALFGTDLARSTQGLTVDVVTGRLPMQLASVAVYVQDAPAPLLYVSPTQINFLVPADLTAGEVSVRVTRQGVAGPRVTITLTDSAPALFPAAEGFILAQDWNLQSALISPAAPAHPGDMVVIYATGLGRTSPAFQPGEIPFTAASIVAGDRLKVLLNDTAVDSALIKYAGLTPGMVGLYQVNVILPGDTPTDPQVRLAVGTQSSLAGMKLAARPLP